MPERREDRMTWGRDRRSGKPGHTEPVDGRQRRSGNEQYRQRGLTRSPADPYGKATTY